RLMQAGGNAVDGGVAAIFAAAVVEISHFGLGGEAPIIIYSARDNRVVVINGQGSAPKAATPQLFAGKDAIPGNGPLGATLPAAVDSAAIALAKYGTKSLSDVRQPNLAATLRALATAEKSALAGGASREQAIQAGRDAFYKGPIAREMTAAVRAAGGVMTEDDLAGYHGKIEEPASAPYRDYTVYKAGFWNQGPSL